MSEKNFSIVFYFPEITAVTRLDSRRRYSLAVSCEVLFYYIVENVITERRWFNEYMYSNYSVQVVLCTLDKSRNRTTIGLL